MKRIDSFGDGIRFAAVAAVAWIPWALVSVPIVGVWSSRAFFLTGVAAAYIGLLGPVRPSRRLLGAAILLCAAALVSAGTTIGLMVTLAAVVGMFRGGIIYGPPTARSVIVELVLLGCGLLLADALALSALPTTMITVWGFFLVQALFFLTADLRAAPKAEGDGERFEVAYRRALELLDE